MNKYTVSEYDYEMALRLKNDDVPFYVLLCAAIMRADSSNLHLFNVAFPEIVSQLARRHG